MDHAYRDEREALRTKLDEAERARTAAEARAKELDAQLELASGERPWRRQAVAIVVVIVLASIGGGAMASLGRGDDTSTLEIRMTALEEADIVIGRVRDHRSCTLHFRHREIDGEHGQVEALCETRIACEHVLYEGLTGCADRLHLRDDEPAEHDGDGLVSVDLLAGTADVDGEAFRF